MNGYPDLDQLVKYLAKTAKDIARGDYHGAGEIFELTKTGEYPPEISELAEAFGMMMVMVEAREERLETLVNDLRHKKAILEETSKALHHANIGVLEVLGNAIAKRDHDTIAHNYRVTYYAYKLGQVAGHSEGQLRSLVKGAFVHDVGKIGISDRILLKEGKLTDDEFQIMKGHVRHGSDIISGYPWLGDCLDIVLHHHEKFDGTGYTAGLKENNIPVNARIFAVADVFDALTSVRPYKRAFTYDETMDIMKKDRGSHFDPAMIDGLMMIGEDIYRAVCEIDEEFLRETLKQNIAGLFADDPIM
jgi:HD-GYP domain-containing protein (c-di-GMP phosphodiesterase class II)